MSKSSLAQAIENRWYGKAGSLLLLAPLAAVFGKISRIRKGAQRKKAQKFSVPVIVVGNITVGGTGKTPTIIALVKFLQAKGLRPGVVSRGYGRVGRDEDLVLARYNDSPELIGDEPALIWRATQCDLAVCANRVEAVQALIDQCHCDVILSDDGLQHYRLYRDAEIALVDGVRQFGNGHLLPVGPLRELPERLQECQWVLVNGGADSGLGSSAVQPDGKVNQRYTVAVEAREVTNILSGESFGLEKLKEFTHILALAGIGHPEKFFTTLENLGLEFERRSFPDHHRYQAQDLALAPEHFLLMTEKDAVKCKSLVDSKAFFLAISMTMPPEFLNSFYDFIVEQQRLRKL